MAHMEHHNPACCKRQSSLPLALVPCGEAVAIVCCNTRDPELERHLNAMGIGPGSVLDVFSNENGRVTVSTGDSRIGIDAALAGKIRVLQVEGGAGCARNRHRFRGRHGFGRNNCCCDRQEEERKEKMQVSISAAVMNRGQVGVIKQVKGDGAVNRRLRDMGLTPGSVISCEGKAPLGDPLEFEIKGYRLTLRKSEAEGILVEVQS